MNRHCAKTCWTIPRASLIGLLVLFPALAVRMFAADTVEAATSQESAVSVEEVNAEQLYYEPLVTLFGEERSHPKETKPLIDETNWHVGLRYKILLLDRENDFSEVTDKHLFHSGDRIRIVFETNVDGYLYIYQRGSSGRVLQLFPDKRINEGESRIRRLKQLSIPPRRGGWWSFDETTGEEEVYVILSSKRVDPLLVIRPNAGNEITGDGWQVVSNLMKEGEQDRSRQLCYEVSWSTPEDEDREPTVAYALTREALLTHKIVLSHRR